MWVYLPRRANYLICKASSPASRGVLPHSSAQRGLQPTSLKTSIDLLHWSPASWLRAAYGPPFTTTVCPAPSGVPAIAYSSIIDRNDAAFNFEKPGQTP